MGQAKQRGTFEQRRLEGVLKLAERARLAVERNNQLRAARLKREAAMTPEDRANSRLLSLMLSGAAVMASGSSYLK